MDSDLRERIEGIHESRPKGAFAPDWNDLEHIDALLRELDPATALEFGSGLSTMVIWDYMKKRGYGVFYALESDPSWYMVNSTTIATSMNMIKCESDDNTPLRGGILFSAIRYLQPPYMRYQAMPLREAEFVYVDGPECVEDYNVVMNVNELGRSPRVILVDGRVRQTKTLFASLCADYEADIDNEHFRTTFRRLDEPRGSRTGSGLAPRSTAAAG